MELSADRHRRLAQTLNAEVWRWLEAPDRTEEATFRMIHAAHASLYHWLQAGSAVHEQRGEWLIAHVYSQLGAGEAALRHATRCMQITEDHPDEMEDFDSAYAHEGLARAYAVLGERDRAAAFKEHARNLGAEIANPEAKSIFDQDFQGGNWHGVR